MLLLDEQAPPGAEPAQLRRPLRLQGRMFETYGYPDGYEPGVSATGVLGSWGGPGNHWVELRGQEVPGHRVESGFSGAAVYDQELRAVVGMVVAEDTLAGAKLGWMLPIRVLTELMAPSGTVLTEIVQSNLLRELAVAPDTSPSHSTDSSEAGGAPLIGRTQALQELISWLTRDQRGDQVRVVTGEPGSGKSVLLAALVALSDPLCRRVECEAATAGQPARPTGEIDLALDVRSKTSDQIIALIAEAAGLTEDPVTGDALLGLLAHRDRLLTLVIDALDDAEQLSQLIDNVLRPLMANATSAHVRVLVAARPRLVSTLGVSDHCAINLDSDRYFDPADLAECARRSLTDATSLGGSPYRGRPESASRVAQAVAHRAGRSFLVAKLTAQALARNDEVVDTAATGWADHFPASVASAMRLYISRLEATDQRRTRDLLVPLAFAQGDGLPEDLWAALATALGTQHYNTMDIRWLLSDTSAGNLLFSTSVGGGATFRLIHQALAEHLRDDFLNTALITDRAATSPGDRAQRRRHQERLVHSQITDVLARHAPERLDGDGRDWARAEPYIRHHLATHAGIAGQIKDLLDDPGYLLAAEPARLLEALPPEADATVSTPERAFRRAARHLRTKPDPDRASYLSMAARQLGIPHFAEQVDALNPAARWSARWAQWHAAHISYLDSRYRFDEKYGDLYNNVCSVAVGKLGDRAVVVTGCGDGGIRVIDLLDGTRYSEFVPDEERAAVAVATAQLDGNPVVISGYEDGTLRVTDMAQSTLLRQWTFYPHGMWTTIVSVVSFDVADQALVAAVTNYESVRLWRIRDGALVGEMHDRDMDLPAEILASVRDQNGLPRLVTLSEPTYPHHGATCVTAAEVDGRSVVVSGHQDGAIYAWDLDNHKPIWKTGTMLDHRGLGAYVDSISVCECRGRPVIAAGGSPGMIGAWNLADGSVAVEPFLSHERDAVRGIAITELEDRTVMIAGGWDRRARVWDAQEHTLLDERAIDTGTPFTPLAVGRPEGRVVIVSGVGEGLVGVWRPSSDSARDADVACERVMPALLTRPHSQKSRKRMRPRWRRVHEEPTEAELQGGLVLLSRHSGGAVRLRWIETGDPLPEDLIGTSSAIPLMATGEFRNRPVALTVSEEGHKWVWRLDEFQQLEPWPTADRQPGAAGGGTTVPPHDDPVVPPWRLLAIGELTAALTAVSVERRGVLSTRPGVVEVVTTTITLSTDSPRPHPKPPSEPPMLELDQAAAIGLFDDQLVGVSGAKEGGLRIWKWSVHASRPTITMHMPHTPAATVICLGLIAGHPVIAWSARDGKLRITSLRDPDRFPGLNIELESQTVDASFVAPGQLAVAGEQGVMILQLNDF